MTIQEKSLRLLQSLKGANVSYKTFAQTAGINVNSLYSWIRGKQMTVQKAEYIISAIQHYFP